MAEDSEKRFHQIMDKLLSYAKPTPPLPTGSPGEGTSIVKKRPHPSSALALVEPKTGLEFSHKHHHSSASAGSSEPPLCRPWDRGDLMRRLATFKSMTWFAKPQVISAVNCARRGWVNVDIDTIACESCGARLLFSTPASWSQQQVEKAASVFSLKLDNGHKLLCPWINNSCDEKLAEFPPMMPQDLADKFKERSCALLQLLALPLISPSAIEFMRCAELEELLEQPLVKEHGNTMPEASQSEFTISRHESCSAKLYYQAQKVISLCGWEPRSLPYVVECKEKSSQLVTTDTNVANLSREITDAEITSISALSSDSDETIGANDHSRHHGDAYDPNSVVLDCKLCGASAGLWVFSTVPRPLEFLRVVGFTEVDTRRKSGEHNPGSEVHFGKDQISNLNLMTIAGGPPATKQNFKATISLPVIGRSLRGRFSSDSGIKKLLSGSHQVAQSENLDMSDNGNDNQRHCIVDHQSPSSENKIAENGAAREGHDTTGGNNVSEQPSERCRHDGDAENSKEIVQGDHLSEQADKNGSTGLAVKDSVNTKEQNASVTRQDSITSSDPLNQQVVAEGFKIPDSIKTKGSAPGNALKSSQPSKETVFDPIRQHRHFCPWIASTGRKQPGWRQTLSALCREKESPHFSPSSDSLIQVDDPITSVRNLFKSPVAKRKKFNDGSS